MKAPVAVGATGRMSHYKTIGTCANISAWLLHLTGAIAFINFQHI
jgi:hypothetical protein